MTPGRLVPLLALVVLVAASCGSDTARPSLQAAAAEANVESTSSTTTTTSTTSTTTTSTTTTTTTTTIATTTTTRPPTTAQRTTVTTPAPAPAPSAPPTTASPPPPVAGSVIAVGDSVMLGAKPQLEGIAGWSVKVDAAVSRQFYADATTALLASAAAQHPSRVVVHLGTNGAIGDAQFDNAMRALAGVPKIIVLTIQLPDASYPHEGPTNDVIRRGAARWGATLVDWNAATNGRTDVLYGDGTHLQPPAGPALFASLVAAAL